MKQRLLVLTLFALTTWAHSAEPSPASLTTVRSARTWVRLERYSGAAGSAAVTPADFRQLALELQLRRSETARESLSVAQRLPYDHVAEARPNLRSEVPLGVIHWTRMLERPAETAPYVTASDVILTQQTVFVCAPLRAITYRGAEVLFTLDSETLYEEGVGSAQTIQTLRLDAGDGSGWQTFGADQPVLVSYNATGSYVLQIEAVLADGTVLTAAAPLEVAALATPNPTETLFLSKAKLYTYKSGDHADYLNPILVVEGFDLDNSMDWDVLYNLLNQEELIESLRALGRDFAVVDFNDATTNIYTNAESVMEAIAYINGHRGDAADAFIVIGASMGGLVTRNALNRMEANPSLYGAHNVDTWISFDSPQEGANIPLGLQEFFNFYGGFAGDYPDLAAALEYRKKLDTVAAQQMLLCHYKNANALAGRSPAYASFETEMQAAGYPSACKKVAIANGSKIGLKHPYAPGQLILYWHYQSFWVGVSSKIYALYNASTPVKPVFYGWFDPWDLFDLIDETVTKNRYYPYSVDNASGGTRASFQELYDTLPSDMKDETSFCDYADHCFIPTTSALGIHKEFLDLAATNAPVLALSPFDETHCAVTNESHIDINSTNKRWFMRVALESRDSDGDGFSDYQEYLMGSAYDSATDKLEVVTALAMPPGSGNTTLSWLTRPNVRYDIYRTDSLDQPWSLVDSVFSDQAALLTRNYPIEPEKKSAFYKIAAVVIDPVTD